MRQQLVFWSWLNGAAIRRRALTRAWIERRFMLWKRTALASVLAQTTTNWRYALICDPRAERFTAPLRDRIADKRVTLVHNGAEEAAWRAVLPRADQYVVARLDSDDRYHPRAGGLYLRCAGKWGSRVPYLQFNSGYAFHDPSTKLYAWKQRSSPFYAHVFGPAYRTGPVPRHLDHNEVHEQARGLPAGFFMVTLHGANTSTGVRSAPLGAELLPPRARRVLRIFQIGRPLPAHYRGAVYSSKVWRRRAERQR